MLDKKILLYSVLPLTTVSFAEETNQQLDEITVTAGYADVYRLSPTKNVIVIEAEDIQNKGYKNIGEVLDDIPTINVGKTGWGDIDIRGQGEGSSAKNIQVMLDGAPITTLVNHPMQTNYNVVPVDNIEKIEIIPGGGSILYGSGSSGGVINITTNLKNIHKTKKSIKIGGGANNAELSAHLGHNFNDRLSAQFSYTISNRDLYFNNTYRDSKYISAGVNYKIKENQNFSLRYSGLFEDGNFVKAVPNKKLDKLGRDYIPKDQKITIGLDKDNHKITKIVPGYAQADRKINSFNATYTGHFNNIKYNTDAFYSKGYFINTSLDLKMNHSTVGVKNKLDIEYGDGSIFEGSSILFGLDAYKQHAKIAYYDYKLVNWKDKTYKIKPLSFDYNKTTTALYALNNFKLKNFDFAQGIRIDKTFWGFDKKASKNSGKDVSNRLNINTSLGLAFNYRDTGKVYARFERSFTAPDGLEITDDFSSSDIEITKAEDTVYKMYEVGFRDEFDFLTVDVTAFYNSTDNEMTRNYVMDDKKGFGRKSINVLKTSRKGFEISLAEDFGNLTLEQSFAYLKGYRRYNGQAAKFGVDVNDIDWTEAGLKKVPKKKFTFTAKYQFNDNWSVSGKYKYSGGYTNFTNEKTSPWNTPKPEEKYIKSHSTVDVNVSYLNDKGLSVSAGVNNLFNKKYFEYVGDRIYMVMPADERSFYFDVKYKF
ncbi:MAG: TonB-dependent receptor [Gammaproteobacteria bacterium]|nr:TonB-dependent receptor [Gammaproteobacteria bacterium]